MGGCEEACRQWWCARAQHQCLDCTPSNRWQRRRTRQMCFPKRQSSHPACQNAAGFNNSSSAILGFSVRPQHSLPTTHQHSVISPLNESPPTRTMRRQGTVRTLGVRDTRGRQRTSMAASPDSSLGHWAPRLSYPRGAGHWGREHSSRRTDSQAVRVVRNSGRTCGYLQPNLPHVFPGSREGGARITHSSLLTQRCVCSLPLGLLHVRDNKFMKCLHCCDALSVTGSL